MWGCVKHPDTWTSGDNTSMSSAACPPGGGGGGHLSSRLLSQRRHCGQHCGPSFSPPSLPAPLSPSTAKLTLHNEEQAGVRAQRAFQECRVPCPGGPESGSWGPLAAQVRGCKFCDAQLTSPQGHSEGTWGGGQKSLEQRWGGPRWGNSCHSQAGFHHAGRSVCFIPKTSQESQEEGTAIDPLDRRGHWRSERLSHLPQSTQMTGQARIRIRPLAPQSGLLPRKTHPLAQISLFHNSV